MLTAAASPLLVGVGWNVQRVSRASQQGAVAIRMIVVVDFACNVCGNRSGTAVVASEIPSCRCGSNGRTRALIHLLSLELFNYSMPLPEFPKLKAIRGLGMTDSATYARTLADKFEYTNTYYDREPRMDFTEAHPTLYGTYDFILSADVLEHVPPPIDRTLDEIARLLKPHGFLIATVPCPGVELKEHFPDLYQYRLVPLGDRTILVNRRRDGELEITDRLSFHDGPGSTLEMRHLTIDALRAGLLRSGFSEVDFFTSDLPHLGIIFDSGASQPLSARKQRFTLDRAALAQLAELWVQQRLEVGTMERLRKQMALASRSRWLRLGRLLGVGPPFAP
jgi:SAM-dependent methyltransferase